MAYLWAEMCVQGERKKWKDGTVTAVFIANAALYNTMRLC